MEILHEDRDIFVAVKPIGAVSEQTPQGDGFADLLAARNNGYVGVVHRLDRAVSGVMVYARTQSAAAELSRAVQEHRFEKVYLAVVHGRPEEASGEMRDLLFFDRQKQKSFVVDRARNGVKEAILDYELLETIEHPEFGELSLVRVMLKTGRTHQIRVQFASRGHALAGDGKYGARDRCEVGLFCTRIGFSHPGTKRPIVFEKAPTHGIFSAFCGENESK